MMCSENDARHTVDICFFTNFREIQRQWRDFLGGRGASEVISTDDDMQAEEIKNSNKEI